MLSCVKSKPKIAELLEAKPVSNTEPSSFVCSHLKAPFRRRERGREGGSLSKLLSKLSTMRNGQRSMLSPSLFFLAMAAKVFLPHEVEQKLWSNFPTSIYDKEQESTLPTATVTLVKNGQLLLWSILGIREASLFTVYPSTCLFSVPTLPSLNVGKLLQNKQFCLTR